MFGFFNKTTFTIEPTDNNRFAIVKNGNITVATYARRRDAVRGATRKGIHLTNA